MTTSESPTHPDAPRAGGETPLLALLDRPAPSEKSCLVCGQVRPFAVWHGPSGAGVCQQCRDARHALRGGATMETPKTHDEFMAALDRIIQHYLGDHGARYGDARFVLDYALSLEDEIQRLRASLLERHRDGEREPEPCGKCGQPQSHPHHDPDRWPGRLTTGHPHHAFVPRSQLTLQDLSGYRPTPRRGEP